MSLRSIWDVPAPAKLNLFLHIVGRRADGYHLLQSVFILIDWTDTLHFEARSDGNLYRHDLSEALPKDDLCLRAARLLQSESGTSAGADLSIDKQVPWGAGMGGGSSDAASTLLALNRLWNLHWPLSRLLVLGLKLGADVPFFLGGCNAWVEGIGEKITPIDVPPHWFAVVKPAANIATQAIFTSPQLVFDNDAATLAGLPADVSVDGLLKGYGRNDLQPPAEAHSDEVAQAAKLLEARFGNSRMTGSGSAVFARAGKFEGADSLPTATIPTDLPAGWASKMCRSLERHPLVGWAAD